jgi:mannose-6-phosphate isomerase-like protein (cupin superfamily)
MAVLLLTTAVLLTAAQVSPTASTPPLPSVYVSHDQAATVIAKPKGPEAASGGAIFSKDTTIRFGIVRRGAGDPEEHDKTSHNWVIIDGEATIVVGGTMIGRHSTGNGEWKGTSAEGGETYHLSKGDMIRIPAGTQHWFKEVPTQTIAFYCADTLK